MQKQPWIGKASTDIVFILLPPFLCLLVIALFPGLFQNEKGIPEASWIILILLIDVAHVYSTLYRTYFDPEAFRKGRTILISIPFVGFIAGVLLYAYSPLLFWRILAYVAVFHFVRQQYGFMRVYSRKEVKTGFAPIIDMITIYYATIYPILYWHLRGPRNFNWFIERDFIYIDSTGTLINILTALYILVVCIYIIKEIVSFIRNKYFNVPKMLIITGTLMSWYFGIVYFNGDLAFTLLNVVSHGIPYMALIWIYGKKNYSQQRKNTFLRVVFSRYGIAIFLGLLFLFAFIEEGLWDLSVWKEHRNIFGSNTFSFSVPEKALAFIIPLLALPQITHYILDGFIWKIKKDDFKWTSEMRKSDSV